MKKFLGEFSKKRIYLKMATKNKKNFGKKTHKNFKRNKVSIITKLQMK